MNARPATVRPPTSAIEAAAADWVTRCDAGLTAAEQQIFQDWLAADARHADAFDRLSEAWAVFDRVQEGGAISAVLAGLERRARQRRTRRVQAA
ncbi:MAG TPA: FecR/PupR family sigma factor regulator, partial [Lacunisphaera sp.]|nr:FecR/PupR family sigma factor regulator [Lacunisphaera sp.]